MSNKIRFFFASLLMSIMGLSSTVHAQTVNPFISLTLKQQSIVLISALTAQGDLEPLEKALDEGLNHGLTINEIKEVLIQMYAYTGFPRSLNGIITFEKVVKARQQKGINDMVGVEPNTVRTDKSKYEIGKDNLALLSGVPPSDTPANYAAFVPTIEVFLKEHLFADIFERGVLDYQTRELVTVSTLASLGNVNAQLRSHMNVSMHNGLTEPQLRSLIAIIREHIGEETAQNADKVLNQVINSRQK